MRKSPHLSRHTPKESPFQSYILDYQIDIAK